MIDQKLKPFSLIVSFEFHILPQALSEMMSKLDNRLFRNFKISSPTQNGVKVIISYSHPIHSLNAIRNDLIERLELKDRADVFKRLSVVKHSIIDSVKITVETKSIKRIKFS